MVFHWKLSDSKSPQVSWTLSTLDDLNSAMVWMVLILPLISSSFSRLLGIVPRAPTTIGINVMLMFYDCFFSLANSKCFSIFSLTFIFTLWFSGMAKSRSWQFLNIRSGLLESVGWSICISKSQRILWLIF